MPLTRSATGMAFLSFLAAPTTAPLLREELAHNKRNELTPRSQSEVDRLATAARKLGYARTGNFIPGISGAALPVFDHSGNMVLALVALGYSRPFDAAFGHIRQAMQREAAGLSARLGGQPAA